MFHKRLLLFAMAGLLLSFTTVDACVCPETPDVSQAVHDARAVFVGKVVRKLKYGVKFKIIQSWKGVSTKFVEIYTSGIRNDCEPRFEKAQTWLVYATELPLFRSEDAGIPYTIRLVARGCSRTTKLKDATRDLAQLETSRKNPNSR